MTSIEQVRVAAAVAAATLSACEPSPEAIEPVSASSAELLVEPVPVSSDGPPDSAESEALSLLRLETRFVSERDFDLWYCSASELDVAVAYRFPATATGDYTLIDAVRGFSVGFESELKTEAARIELNYPTVGVVESLTSISFTTPDAWQGQSSTDGDLSCERRSLKSTRRLLYKEGSA